MKIRNQLIDSLLRILKVPLTFPISNSFYQNLTDIYNLKELLYDEGIADYNGITLIKSDDNNTLLLPQGH